MNKYDDLTREQLIELHEKRDRTKKLGLVWERDEIEADKAIDENFIAATLDETLSDKAAPWKNLVMEGDNFDALRWLRMTHAGKIKCIYVDPPYNTGNKDWVYNDNYVDKEDRYRFSTWLEFLYRRFMLARELLTEDGVILVSINDEHRALMELMLDEALPGMRVGSFVWRTRTGGNEGGDHFFTANHEHVLCFANSGFRFSGTSKSLELYNQYDNKFKDWYQPDNMVQSKTRFERPNSYFPLHDPQTDIWYPCNPDSVWRFVSENTSDRTRNKTIEQLVNEGRIRFPVNQEVRSWDSAEELKNAIELGEVPKSGRSLLLRKDLPDLDFWIKKYVGFGTPRYKRFKGELRTTTQPLSSWITPRSESKIMEAEHNLIVSGTNDEGSKSVKDIFGIKMFNYPKPTSLLKGLVSQSSSSNDTILDFFAGSATTAQAVMELNAEDGGDRNFIMVSSTEATKSEPDKNLCRDITAERIRLLNASDDKKYAGLAAEFAYLKTREIDFGEIDYELKPGEAWNALEALHGLPLTPYDATSPWNEHAGEHSTLIYVDEVNEAVFKHIEDRAGTGQAITVYSWSPGQLRDRLSNLNTEIQSVRSTLVKRFQQ